MFLAKGKEPKETKEAKGFSGPEIPPEEIKLIEPPLGEGCFGKVYKALCFAEKVAVKVPLMQELDDDEIEALRSEVELMSAKPHANIVLFMGACTQPGQFRIVTELMDGDLEHLLQDSKTPLSLYDRMMMAKDAALGMNWLHCVSPPIIHRDLKSANLLVKKRDDRYVVKVCDFGLAALKPKTQKTLRDGKDGAKGTPLYMPPEVMMGKPFNEKADVYSYGIVLWEILTKQDPFPHHSDYDVFVDAVCRKGERPPIPPDTLPLLKKLVERCWDRNPKKRPSFTEICGALDQILIQCAVSDTEGQRFWKEFFVSEHKVSWSHFHKAFYKFLGIAVPAEGVYGDISEEVPAAVVNLRLLEALFSTESHGEKVVKITHFGELLEWFGPLEASATGTAVHPFLDAMRLLVSNKWFHGDIDAAEAQLRLDGQPAGSFLIRFSSSPGAFTITRKTTAGIGNVRIGHKPGESFSVGKDKKYESLPALIAALSGALGLHTACPGSRFCALVENSEMEAPAYEVVV